LAISEYPSLQLANRQVDLNAAVEQIWQGKGSELMRPIFDTYNDDLHRAVTSDNEESAKLFKNNVSRLAAAKDNYTIQQLERCKADINGVARSKEEYQKAAKVVIGRANRAQAAEYNTTSHRCRVAKQWAQFTKEKRLFPNIEWLRTRSASPRELHLTYVGRIWAMDDPFLKNNTPGCIWNCKCDWKNTDKAVTDNGDITPVPVAPGLEGNPYYTNEIFSNKHPYFSRVNKHIPDVGVLYNPDDVVYIKKTTKSGIEYKVHYNCLNEKELAINEKAIKNITEAGYGKDIKLLPRIYSKEIELRERYYGKAFQSIQKNDCPDAIIDGKLVEFKSSSNKMASKRILQAAQKSEVAYLELTDGMPEHSVESFIKRQWGRTDIKRLETIIINNNGKTSIFTRTNVEVFTEAKNIDEAEKIAKSFGFKEVKFKDVPIDHVNSVLEALHKEHSISGKINIDRLSIETMRSYGTGIKGGHFISKEVYRQSEIAFNADAFKINFYKPPLSFDEQLIRIKDKIIASDRTIKMFEEKIKPDSNKSFIKMIKKQISAERSRILDYKLATKKIERAIENGESPIPNTINALLKDVKDQIKCTVHHEFAHYIDDALEFPKFKDVASPSVYGSDRAECFAEYYAKFRMFGEKDIPDELLDIFKKWNKK